MKDSRTYGRPCVVEVEIYDECKYTAGPETFENHKTATYEIESWDIVTGYEAREIEELTEYTFIDPCHEYLVLHLTDGDTATFRNSYVDMFRVRWA